MEQKSTYLQASVKIVVCKAFKIIFNYQAFVPFPCPSKDTTKSLLTHIFINNM